MYSDLLLIFSAICLNSFKYYIHLNTQLSHKRLIAYAFNIKQNITVNQNRKLEKRICLEVCRMF